jgi:alpha-glucoside transport system permease protein
MSGGASITAEPPPREAPPPAGPSGSERARRWTIAAAFLAPAAVLLGVWVVYPAIRTIIRSFFDRAGDEFVWFANFKELFTSDLLLTAIKNNALWVAIVPAFVTAIGLIFAVLTERVRWSVAFKTAVFMPMAISLLAAGVIWRLMYVQDPGQGAVNAGIAAVKGVFEPTGALPNAEPSTPQLVGNPGHTLTLKKPLAPGGVALLGLSAIAPEDVPSGAKQAVKPPPKPGGITGVVWRDFRPGGGVPGKVEKQEVGIPGVTLQLRDSAGKEVATAASADNGTFTFDDLAPGRYTVAISGQTFAKPFGGVSWLGDKLITPAIMIAYIWVWAGFAMVVIAAGLAAIPRDVLEAARTDGATEWQTFRRVTVPLLGPILSVVFITMIINVLKVFDIVISVAPSSSQDDANVIALAMWRTSFGGENDFGVGSAMAVFLFVLVLPVLALNIRRFKREV